MREEYIQNIIHLLYQVQDISLLDLILKMLQKFLGL